MTVSKADKQEALQRIARDAEVLRDLARRADVGVLGFLLEHVLHEARSQLLADGLEPMPPDQPSNVTPLKPG
jgi:hypothetical protein